MPCDGLEVGTEDGSGEGVGLDMSPVFSSSTIVFDSRKPEFKKKKAKKNVIISIRTSKLKIERLRGRWPRVLIATHQEWTFPSPSSGILLYKYLFFILKL